MAAKKVMKGSTKRKIKVFAILLTCSFVAWLLSQLSETYTDDITFSLNYVNPPDSLMMMGASRDEVTLTVRGSGWQFLGSRFSSGTLNVDLSRVSYNRGRYFLRERNYGDQLASALPKAMTIVKMDSDSLLFRFSRLVKKKVPVIPGVRLQLAQNYLMEKDLEVTPDSVTLTGPHQELDTVREIRTVALELREISESFVRSLQLEKPERLSNTFYSTGEVQVKGEVFRFSEKILDVPVEVINLPEGVQVKTFPNSVEVLCKARLETLKGIESSDFRIVADLAEVHEDSPFLQVRMDQKPEGVPGIQMMQLQVEYILKRE
jgi:hypothetical protein